MENMEFKDLPKALEQLIEGEQSEILKAQFRWMIAFFNEHYEAEK